MLIILPGQGWKSLGALAAKNTVLLLTLSTRFLLTLTHVAGIRSAESTPRSEGTFYHKSLKLVHDLVVLEYCPCLALLNKIPERKSLRDREITIDGMARHWAPFYS